MKRYGLKDFQEEWGIAHSTVWHWITDPRSHLEAENVGGKKPYLCDPTSVDAVVDIAAAWNEKAKAKSEGNLLRGRPINPSSGSTT